MPAAQVRSPKRFIVPLQCHCLLLLLLLSLFQGSWLCNAEQDDQQCEASDYTSGCTSTTTDEFMVGTGVLQETGHGKIPTDVVEKVQQAICNGNHYYSSLQTQDAYRLTIVNCVNHNPLCAYWSVRGQCTSDNYTEFMAKECPLACQLCHTETLRARALLDLLYQDLTLAYQKGNNRNAVQDRHQALSTLMTKLDMDPELLRRPLRKDDGNWLETLHQRFMALIPPPMLPIYTRDPSPADTRSLALIHGLSVDTPPSRILSQIAVLYRHRGHILNILAEPMDHLVIRPLQLGVAFAIPNQAAIEAIRSLDTPILEMGAGSGYWTALLRHAGITVQAHDLQGTDRDGHTFYDFWYTPDLHRGSCVSVLAENPNLATTHALLLIWPNDPDPVDHPHLCPPGSPCARGSQPVWDAACLRAFLQAGGGRVVLVGERESVLRERYPGGGAGDAGISATREFQTLLKRHFRLQRRVAIPTMWLNEDDLTVWERRGVIP